MIEHSAMRFAFHVILAAMIFCSLDVRAQSPVGDCRRCDALIKPESGFWHFPGAVGSGFALRFYDRTVAGVYLGFDRSQQQWLTFSGTIEPTTPNEKDAGGWQVTADLYRASGSGCLGCAPVVTSSSRVARVDFEFLSRSHGRYRIDGARWIPLELFAFGYPVDPAYSSRIDYELPLLDGPWTLVFRDAAAGNVDAAAYYSWTAWAYGDGDIGDPILSYLFSMADSASESEPIADLSCRAGNNGPTCVLSQYFGRHGIQLWPDREFQVRPRDITATRFKGRSADGSTVEGLRVGID